jgi:hypothetical protein
MQYKHTTCPRSTTEAPVLVQDIVDKVDLTVGSAGSAEDQVRLQTVVGLQLAAPTPLALNITKRFAARSVEGGLLTLAVLGKASLFSQQKAIGYSLEIEDLVTLHVTGDSAYDQVVKLLGVSGSGFKVVNDLVLNRGSLVASSELEKHCSTELGPMTLGACLLRYDIRARKPIAGLAYEVQPNQNASSSAFMKGLVGTSDFAGALGANFSQLLSAKYQLVPGGKARRVFWINPGIKWAASVAANRFTLSQHVVLVVLIHLITEAGVSRRALLATQASSSGSPAPGASVSAVEYETNLRDIMADALGLPIDHVGSWKITMALAADQACAATADLGIVMRKTFVGYMDKAATAVEEVGIQSVALNIGAISCSGGQQARRTGEQGGATGAFDTIVAFKTGADPPSLSIAVLLKMPGVLAVVPMIVPAAIGGDSGNSESADQKTPPAAIWAPICVVSVALAALLARQRILRSDPQKASAGPTVGGTDDSMDASSSGGCVSFLHGQQKSLNKASDSSMTHRKPRESLEAAEISVMLGFMSHAADNGLRRSLDHVRHVSSKLYTHDSKVAEDPEKTAQAQPAVIKVAEYDRETVQPQQAVLNASLGSETLTVVPTSKSIAPNICIQDAARLPAQAARPKRSKRKSMRRVEAARGAGHHNDPEASTAE